MKRYISVALLIGGVCAVICFYRFAFHQGKQSCEYESYQKMIAIISGFQEREKEINHAVRQVKNDLERSKNNDQICDDVLRFDVRRCLSK